MYRLYQSRDPEDFQARVRFFPLDEGGRRSYPNGIRFDFKYIDDEKNIYMIHPDFYDLEGNSFSTEEFLPLGVWLSARMYIIAPEMKEKMHRVKIQEGVEFYCVDGPRRVAKGIVSKVVGLNAKHS